MDMKSAAKRYISLDVLRGVTVAMMIVVNSPGSWTVAYPMLKHAEWNGCTPCDLVFPFFLFCVGVSMAFALAKYDSLNPGSLGKIFKRGALLYLVGLLLTGFPFYNTQPDLSLSFWQNWLVWLSELRLVGVLPRIALCYVTASCLALWLKSAKKIVCAIGVLSLLHISLLLLFGGPEGALTLEGNFAGKVDIAVFGSSHIYHGYGIPFDPEGLLGVLTGSCTVLIGYLTGQFIRRSSIQDTVSASAETSALGITSRIFVQSAFLLLGGMVLSIWIPLNKPLWSVSYVLYAAGWASFVLALMIYLIDYKGWQRIFLPFRALGMNALVLFVLSGLLMKINWIYIGWNYGAVFGSTEFRSLLFALMYLTLHLVIAVIMYKKKIFIKL